MCEWATLDNVSDSLDAVPSSDGEKGSPHIIQKIKNNSGSEESTANLQGYLERPKRGICCVLQLIWTLINAQTLSLANSELTISSRKAKFGLFPHQKPWADG